MKIGCVIMASGLGKRFGGNKLMASFDGAPMIQKVLTASQNVADQTIVVTRHTEVADYVKHLGYEAILHQLPSRSDTIRLGLTALNEMDGCLFCPGDQPLLTEASLLALRRRLEIEPDHICALSAHHKPGSPVLFPKWCFPELLSLPEGKGGRLLLKKYPQLVSLVEATNPSELMDADTPETFFKLEELWKQQRKKELSALLQITPGITAIIGGGGKTSLMLALAKELKKRGRVILTTTTHIWPPDSIPILNSKEDLMRTLKQTSLVCAGSPAEDGKLRASDIPMETLKDAADFVLVEADGSRQFPMKAHRTTEPVIPANANQTIQVIGIDCFFRPIQETVHCPDIFCRICGTKKEDPVTPDAVLRLLSQEHFADRIYLNKVETAADWAVAEELRKKSHLPLTAGSIHKEDYQ